MVWRGSGLHIRGPPDLGGSGCKRAARRAAKGGAMTRPYGMITSIVSGEGEFVGAGQVQGSGREGVGQIQMLGAQELVGDAQLPGQGL